MGSEPRLEAKVTRRLLPFAAIGLLSLLTPVLPPQPDDWAYVWIAFGLTFAIAASGFLVPWSRLPRWTYLLPPLSYFVVVALLRHASDGSVSGYAPLALLPVVWIALNLGRKEVAIGVVGGASVLVVPLLVGDPANYTDERLAPRRAVDGGRRARRLLRRSARARDAGADADRSRSHADAVSGPSGRNLDVSRALTAETDAREQHLQSDLRHRRGVPRDDLGARRRRRPRSHEPGRAQSGAPSSYARRGAVRDGSGVHDRGVVLRRGRRRGCDAPPGRRGANRRRLDALRADRPQRHPDRRPQRRLETIASATSASGPPRSSSSSRSRRPSRSSEQTFSPGSARWPTPTTLTGLPNRRTWNETIRQAVATRRALRDAALRRDRRSRPLQGVQRPARASRRRPRC